MKLAVIPARGGSKRIPHKNIKPFVGKPIIAYSIEAALSSGLFDKVVVSTDDEAIAAVARDFGAEVPFMRPEAIAGDVVSARAAVHHAREFFQAQGCQVDYTCCIYATAPFIQAQYLSQGLERLQSSDKVYSFSVVEFEYTPYRGFIFENDKAKLLYPEHRNSRSQELATVYHDAGQFYWTKVQASMQDEPLVGSDFEPVVLPKYLVHDIDTQDDWLRAEMMYSYLDKAAC